MKASNLFSKVFSKGVIAMGLALATFATPLAGVVTIERSVYAAPNYEQSVFEVKGLGNVWDHVGRESGFFPLSPYTPTGIYIAPNETVHVNVQGATVGTATSLSAMIGNYNPISLKVGDNVISSSNGGNLYFYNTETTGSATVEVTQGGTHFPLFQLGKHTKADWDAMLAQFPDAQTVELLGERTLITATYAKAKEQVIDPVQLLTMHDEVVRIQEKLTGLTVDGIFPDQHYVHHIQSDYSHVAAIANDFRILYSNTSMNTVLNNDLLATNAIVPFHETGHLFTLSELAINIETFAELLGNITQKELGQPITLNNNSLIGGNVFTKASDYLNQPNKDFGSLNPYGIPVVPFYQLYQTYGFDFYTELFEKYRQNYFNSYDESVQFFIIESSKIAEQNLIPFYEKWAMFNVSDATKQTVAAFGYPLVKDNIWNSTDENPVALTKESTLIKLNETSLQAKTGDSGQLGPVIVQPKVVSKDLVYSSSDTGVVTVDQQGNWVAKGAGTAIITVQTTSGATATVTVEVQSVVSAEPVLLHRNSGYGTEFNNPVGLTPGTPINLYIDGVYKETQTPRLTEDHLVYGSMNDPALLHNPNVAFTFTVGPPTSTPDSAQTIATINGGAVYERSIRFTPVFYEKISGASKGVFGIGFNDVKAYNDTKRVNVYMNGELTDSALLTPSQITPIQKRLVLIFPSISDDAVKNSQNTFRFTIGEPGRDTIVAEIKGGQVVPF